MTTVNVPNPLYYSYGLNLHTSGTLLSLKLLQIASNTPSTGNKLP